METGLLLLFGFVTCLLYAGSVLIYSIVMIWQMFNTWEASHDDKP